jgi:D-alanyl-lipoteichoic acid acyltransferase DltB (MBOAT superfamily)
MLFNTFQFLIFLLVLLPTYYALPHRYRLSLLLVTSYYFYMCYYPPYGVLILAATLINYGAAYGIDHLSSRLGRQALLMLAIVLTIGMLFVFKYVNFTLQSINDVSRFLGSPTNFLMWNIILPAGISFYSFQTISYTIDVYRRSIHAERNPFVFAAFVSFFPQLVAGPIERATNLLPQMTTEKKFSVDDLQVGLRWILMGMFKKVVVADSFAVVAGTVFAHPERFSGPLIVLGLFFFAIQLYGDFSGYSDIATGVARLFGFRLMTNFRQPYLARSVAEYWQRWHISLTTWFRDYIYYPLGGNRLGWWVWARNVTIIFLVSGVWHGANWTYVVFGLLHAVLLIVQQLLSGPYLKVTRLLQLHRVPYLLPLVEWGTTLALILFGYIIFRSPSLSGAWTMISRLGVMENLDSSQLVFLGLQRFEMMMSVIWTLVMFSLDLCLGFQPAWVMKLWGRRPIRWGIYLLAVYSIALFGVFESVEFIYFKF